MSLWSRGLVRWRDNLKSLYPHYRNVCGHETWQAGDLLWETSTNNVTPTFGHVVKITWQTKTIISPLPDYLLAKILARLWLPFTHKVIWPYNHLVLWDQVTNWKHYISATTISMDTKLGRMMNYLEWHLPISSHDHIITCSCKITWPAKVIIYQSTQCLWLSTLAFWGYTMRNSLE